MTVPEILEHKIKIPLDRQEQIAWNRVARVLVANGWECKRRRINGSRTWLYVPITPEPEPQTGDTGDGVGTEKQASMPVSLLSPLGFDRPGRYSERAGGSAVMTPPGASPCRRARPGHARSRACKRPPAVLGFAGCATLRVGPDRLRWR